MLNNLKNNKDCKIVHYKNDLYYLFGKKFFLYDAKTKEKSEIDTKEIEEYLESHNYSYKFISCLKLQNNKVLIWGYESDIDGNYKRDHVVYHIFDMDTNKIRRLRYARKLPYIAPVLLDDGTIFWADSSVAFISKFKEGVL